MKNHKDITRDLSHGFNRLDDALRDNIGIVAQHVQGTVAYAASWTTKRKRPTVAEAIIAKHTKHGKQLWCPAWVRKG